MAMIYGNLEGGSPVAVRGAARRIGAALAAAASLAACASDPPTAATEAPLVVHDVRMWTLNASIIPMCWHFTDGFDAYVDPPGAIAAAEQFVKDTIQHYWADPLNLTVSWTTCPTSGAAPHVRAMLRAGDPSYNGSTVRSGMDTLTTPAQRAADVTNVSPGLLLGFPTSWNDDDTEREQMRGLVLHEFGHILGFGHEKDRSDGKPDRDACYEQAAPHDGYELGPLDPTSIMGWSYCTNAGTVPSADDIEGARGFYGTSATHFDGPYLWSDATCAANGRCRLADVTGDGRADLINPFVVLSRAYVSVMRSNGAGFEPPQIWTTDLCSGGTQCEFADVDGDNRADLVAFQRGASPRVLVARSTGTGFAAPTQWTDFACLDGEVCKVADINRDGRADLVVFTHNQNPVVWTRLSTGRGAFGPSQLWNGYFCTPTETCEVGDVDGDGRADIVAFTHSTSQVWVARSNGSAFVANALWRGDFCHTGDVCLLGDVNMDQRADAIAFGHQSGDAGVTVARASRSAPELEAPTPWVTTSFCQPDDTCLVGDIDRAWGVDAVAVRHQDVWANLSSP